jgi:hypothetical protein
MVRNIDERQHALHRDGDFAAGVKQAVPGGRAQIDRLGEAVDPNLPDMFLLPRIAAQSIIPASRSYRKASEPIAQIAIVQSQAHRNMI